MKLIIKSLPILLLCFFFSACENNYCDNKDTISKMDESRNTMFTKLSEKVASVSASTSVDLLYKTEKISFLVWNSSGSPVNRTAGFYRPKTGDYKAIGHRLVADIDYHDNLTPDMTVVWPVDPSAVAYPVDYTLIWNDKGSGASKDVSVWRPIPPSGYVAMGSVSNNSYNKPGLTAVVCIRSDLVSLKSCGSLIWNDKGSGAQRDFSGWGVGYGLFVGSSNYNKPSTPVYTFTSGVTQYIPN